MADSTGAAGHGRSAAPTTRRTASSHPGRVFLATVSHVPPAARVAWDYLLDGTIRQAWGPVRPLVVDSNDQLATLIQFPAIEPEREHVKGETTCASLHPAGPL